MQYKYIYEIVFEMALKELPEDFSFQTGEYRKILNEKLMIVNERGNLVANPKNISILEEKTTSTALALLLKSQEKLQIPTRGCKALSRHLAETKEFGNLLAKGGEKGKLFVGREWKEIISEENQEKKAVELTPPDIMKVLAKALMRYNAKDKKMFKEIGDFLMENDYLEEE